MIVIGLMSGTSADGVDVAICDIRGRPGEFSVEFVSGATFAYERIMRERILASCDPGSSRVNQSPMHVDLAAIFAIVPTRQFTRRA